MNVPGTRLAAATLAIGLAGWLAAPLCAVTPLSTEIRVTLVAPATRPIGAFYPVEMPGDGAPEQFLFDAAPGPVSIALSTDVACGPLDIRLMRINRQPGRPLARARRGVRAVGPGTRPLRASLGGREGAPSPDQVLRALLAAEGTFTPPTALSLAPHETLSLSFDVPERPEAADLFVWARGPGEIEVAAEAAQERRVTLPGPRLHGPPELIAIDLDPVLDSLWLGAVLKVTASHSIDIDRVELRAQERLPVGSAPIGRVAPPPGPVTLEPRHATRLDFADPHLTPGVSSLLLLVGRGRPTP